MGLYPSFIFTWSKQYRPTLYVCTGEGPNRTGPTFRRPGLLESIGKIQHLPGRKTTGETTLVRKMTTLVELNPFVDKMEKIIREVFSHPYNVTS